MCITRVWLRHARGDEVACALRRGAPAGTSSIRTSPPTKAAAQPASGRPPQQGRLTLRHPLTPSPASPASREGRFPPRLPGAPSVPPTLVFLPENPAAGHASAHASRRGATGGSAFAFTAGVGQLGPLLAESHTRIFFLLSKGEQNFLATKCELGITLVPRVRVCVRVSVCARASACVRVCLCASVCVRVCVCVSRSGRVQPSLPPSLSPGRQSQCSEPPMRPRPRFWKTGIRELAPSPAGVCGRRPEGCGPCAVHRALARLGSRTPRT